MRYVITTSVCLGRDSWPVELTLTDRKSMRFRMLLGRAAISDHLMVDPAKSYLCGRRLSRVYPKRPKERKDST